VNDGTIEMTVCCTHLSSDVRKDAVQLFHPIGRTMG
jgi:hypothetical protein